MSAIYRLALVLSATVFFVAAIPQASRAQAAAKPAVAPLGIGLEEYSYPYPISFLELMIDGKAQRLAYMDVQPTGPASGKVVLLMHGRNFPASYWAPTIKVLSAAGHRVIAPDQIHFGKSSKPDDVPVSFEMMANHMALLLDKLSVQQIDLVAHSMGNMAAVRFARSYPQRLGRLVMYGPVGLEDYRRYVPAVPRDRLLQQETNLTGEQYFTQLMNTYNPQLTREQMWPFVELRVRMAESSEFPRWVRSYVSSFYAMWSQPMIHEIDLVTAPTLIMVGSKDRTAPGRPFASEADRARMGLLVDRAKDAAARMPNARVDVFDGFGHMLHLEAPERFNETVIAFLK